MSKMQKSVIPNACPEITRETTQQSVKADRCDASMRRSDMQLVAYSIR